MNILPGEPVPPGFEDEVNRVAEIQKTIDQYKSKPIIGIEYTIELHENDRNEPAYLCTLCDKRGDPRTIINHWVSINHRTKFLERHFPTASRELVALRFKPHSHIILNQVTHTLAKAIEDRYGRLNVSVFNADDYRRMRTKIIQEIANKFHHDERLGSNLVDLIDRSLWERVAPGSQQTATASDPTLKVTIKNTKRTAEGGAGLDEISSESDCENSSGAKKIKTKNSNDGSNEKKLPTPKELSMQASHIAQERYKWEKYRCMLEIQLKQMRKIQSDYEINPEKHPMYPAEWKKFWNQRYKELQAEGSVDPNKYDYKPEWIAFWTKRMKEIFDEDVDKKKLELKRKLDLPENLEEDKVDQLKERYKVQVSSKTRNFKNPTKVDVIDISDDEPATTTRRRFSRSSRSRSYSSSLSPPPTRARERPFGRGFVDHRANYASRMSERSEFPMSHGRSLYSGSAASAHGYGHGHGGGGSYRVLDSHHIPKYMRSPSGHRSPSSLSARNEPNEKDAVDEGPLTVVSVLRLVTALEEHLGSLAHKVVDMLGKALALEKIKANSSDDLNISLVKFTSPLFTASVAQ